MQQSENKAGNPGAGTDAYTDTPLLKRGNTGPFQEYASLEVGI